MYNNRSPSSKLPGTTSYIDKKKHAMHSTMGREKGVLRGASWPVELCLVQSKCATNQSGIQWCMLGNLG